MNELLTAITTNATNENTGARVYAVVLKLLQEVVPSYNIQVDASLPNQPLVPIIDFDSLNGSGNKLPDLLTVDLTVGIIIGVNISNRIRYFRLTSGTDLTSSPNIIRPGDYAGSTNEKVWKLMGEYEITFTNSDLTASKKLQAQHDLKNDRPEIQVINNSGYIENALSILIDDQDNITIDIGSTISGTWKLRVSN